MCNMLIDERALQMRNPGPEVGGHEKGKEVKNFTGVPPRWLSNQGVGGLYGFDVFHFGVHVKRTM